MLIGSKLPPHHVNTTYFSSGRAAFAYIIGELVKPRKVYLPTFVPGSLVSTMERRFTGTTIEFYPVARDLTCEYPMLVGDDELLVFIHYFGHENRSPRPPTGGCSAEDLSHSYLSGISTTGTYVFGSYRKIMKVGDGGFLEGFYNPIYEATQKLDTWLRYQAKDWRDIREAENMLDRDSSIGDISSQSLAILLQTNEDVVVNKRRANNSYLDANLPVGRPLIQYREHECPMVHNRMFDSTRERDSLRDFLAERGVFTSVHWPTHKRVLAERERVSIDGALWLESCIMSTPISDDYGLNDMEQICELAGDWARAGG